HDTLLYVLTSLKLIEPPPLKKPITPNTRKNKIGKKTNHSRKSRLIENHSFLPSAITGCRTIWRSLFVLRFFFFLLLPSLSWRSEGHTSELQSSFDLVCRLLLE